MKIHLTDDLSYRQLVSIFNQMLEDDQKRYALIDNDFYLLGDKENNEEVVECNTLMCGYTHFIEVRPNPSPLSILKKAGINFVNNWLLITGFILLIVAPQIIHIHRNYERSIFFMKAKPISNPNESDETDWAS